jgi:hypothetical protein
MTDVDDHDDAVNADDDGGQDDAWEEPVEDVDALDDGPRTIIVGGSSRVESIDDALERYRGPGDRIVVMPGVYETGMILDAGRFPRLHIVGAHPAPTDAEERAARAKRREEQQNADEIAEREAAERYLPPLTFGPQREPVVIFRGKLSVQYQDSTATSYDEEEGAKLADGAVPLLTVSNIAFNGGASIAEQADIALDGCTFGIAHLGHAERGDASSGGGDDAVREQRTVRVHAFATPNLTRCRIYGADRSALYCYPFAKAALTGCDIAGMVSPPPPPAVPTGSLASLRRLKAAQAPPPPPATAPPTLCLSDVGVHLDDSACTFSQCAIHNFNIGLVTNEACRGTKLSECIASEISTVGFFFAANAAVNVRECKARLCGREAALLGARSHVSMRDCAFAGDVRLKDGAVLTALVDNAIGPEAARWCVINEAPQFADRGFLLVEDDPSQRKKRKPPPVEE